MKNGIKNIAANKVKQILIEAAKISKQHSTDSEKYGEHYTNTLLSATAQLRVKILAFKAQILITLFDLK